MKSLDSVLHMTIANEHAAMDSTSRKYAPGNRSAIENVEGYWPDDAQPSGLYQSDERGLREHEGALRALQKLLASTRLQAHSSLTADRECRAAIKQECGQSPLDLLYHKSATCLAHLSQCGTCHCNFPPCLSTDT